MLIHANGAGLAHTDKQIQLSTPNLAKGLIYSLIYEHLLRNAFHEFIETYLSAFNYQVINNN